MGNDLHRTFGFKHSTLLLRTFSYLNKLSIRQDYERARIFQSVNATITKLTMLINEVMLFKAVDYNGSKNVLMTTKGKCLLLLS